MAMISSEHRNGKFKTWR